MTPLSRLQEVDITSASLKRDPYPFYAQLRAQHPVLKTHIGKREAWLITRYDDVAAVLKDSRLVKNRHTVGARSVVPLPRFLGLIQALERNMLDVDGADHARLRALVHHAFTPRMIEGMRGRIQQTTDALLDELAQVPGPVDLISHFALPLPLAIICEMLGIPPEDRSRFHTWVRQALAVTSSEAGRWGMIRGIGGVLQLFHYVRRQIRRKRTAPQNDLLSALIQAEEAGERLSEDELVAMVFILLIAGHETTVNLIGNGALALMTHPEQLALLCREPEMTKSAVEELARYASPVETATERYAAEDLEIAGTVIPRGALVFAVLASANRDETQFVRPDDLDLTRSPNRHLAFGLGVHYCVGAPLARMEAQIALSSLVARFPDLHLGALPQALRWRPLLLLRGLETLPVQLGKNHSGS
ncbi:cytochrome P450 [Deinococcus oregonensis]|uniref:Cytochrome P450 n=1 Tax=Deinococcus oregonensis TaxID=1805970 RepID=A0ABV6AXR3_9DEIO